MPRTTENNHVHENVWETLEFLVDLGTAQLQAGLTAGETVDSVRTCAAGLGLTDILVEISGKTLMIQHVDSDGHVSVRAGHVGSLSSINCEQLRRLDEVSVSVSEGRDTTAEAGRRVAAIGASSLPAWWTVGGLTLLAFCIGLQVGGTSRTAFCSAIVHLAASLVGLLNSRFGIAPLLGATLQSIVGAVLAAGFYFVGIVTLLEAAGCVAVSWMLLVPLPLLILLVVDLVTTNHLAAIARLSVLFLVMCGISVGAIVVLSVASAMTTQVPSNVDLPTLAIPLSLMFSILGAVANALANNGGRSLILPAAAIGLLTACCNQSLIHLAGLPAEWASTLSAVVLGLVVATWAKRSDYPAPVLALMGITGSSGFRVR